MQIGTISGQLRPLPVKHFPLAILSSMAGIDIRLLWHMMLLSSAVPRNEDDVFSNGR